MSPKSASWLRANAGNIPHNFSVVEQTPVIRLFPSPLGSIGIVFFPEGSSPGNAPSERQVEVALAAGRSLTAKQARLIIGVSPWGYLGERNFLSKAKGVFNCILGGGEGVAMAHSLSESPDILWIRPDSQGRAVNILEIITLPLPGESWIENRHFTARLEFLGSEYPEAPAMLEIVGQAPKK